MKYRIIKKKYHFINGKGVPVIKSRYCVQTNVRLFWLIPYWKTEKREICYGSVGSGYPVIYFNSFENAEKYIETKFFSKELSLLDRTEVVREF